MSWIKKYQSLGLIAASFFVVVGTYNAVVINSESSLYGSDVKFVKRLDEMYGVTVPGRDAASLSSWQKIPSASRQVVAMKPQFVTQTVSKVQSAPSAEAPADANPTAAVQDELSLDLVEVINPKKWQNGLPNTQFTGNLATNQGVIESLNVSLPNGEGISVSFSEMTGNVFNYDLDGELYSGMMYQVDQNSYMVTLSNGPLEGTRLRFNGTPAEPEYPVEVAQNEVDMNNYGNNVDQYEQQQKLEEAQMEQAQNQVEQGIDQQQQMDPQSYDQQLQQQSAQAYNFEQQPDQQNPEVTSVQ